MRHSERLEQQRALADWLESYDWKAFGTLKFTDGASINERKADGIAQKYFNSLDRAYLGRTMVDAGHRLERAVFKQFGHSGCNLHFHFVANPSSSIEHFCETAKCLWDEASRFTMGYENTIIEPVRSVARCGSYGLHEYRKLGADTLFLEATHLDQNQPATKPIQKLRRLLIRHDKNEGTQEAGRTRDAARKKRKHTAAQTATH